MLAYTTLSQLTDRFGAALLIALTDRGPVATGLVVQAPVDRAIADTAAVIDGYLAARYALPLVTVPALVGDLAQVIAIYKLHPYAPDPKIDADYKEAMRTLREIATGSVRIPVAGLDPVGTGTSGAMITDRERPLTEATMKGFI